MPRTCWWPSGPAARGLPTGALVLADKRTIHPLKVALKAAGWGRQGVHVTPFTGVAPEGLSGKPCGVAVHVSAAGAVAIEALIARGDFDSPIGRMLQGGDVAWYPGLRIHSPLCERKGKGGSPKDMADGDTEEQPPPAFRFSELFAGIGGFRLGLQKWDGKAVFASGTSGFRTAGHRVGIFSPWVAVLCRGLSALLHRARHRNRSRGSPDLRDELWKREWLYPCGRYHRNRERCHSRS